VLAHLCAEQPDLGMEQLGISTLSLIKALEVTHYTYPFALAFFFGLAYTAHGILTGENQSASSRNSEQRGQLSKKSRTRSILTHTATLTPLQNSLLNWLIVFIIFTFVCNAANVIVHALMRRGWWCGQAYVVCSLLRTDFR
jgi:hypothetical protein